jgi:hypothetical protein
MFPLFVCKIFDDVSEWTTNSAKKNRVKVLLNENQSKGLKLLASSGKLKA